MTEKGFMSKEDSLRLKIKADLWYLSRPRTGCPESAISKSISEKDTREGSRRESIIVGESPCSKEIKIKSKKRDERKKSEPKEKSLETSTQKLIKYDLGGGTDRGSAL